MGNSSSSNAISAQDRAILEMKTQRDKIHQYQKRITALTSRETAIARECLARGQKGKALLALRRKKYQQSLLQKADLQLEQLQRLTDDVEFAAVQKDVMFGLQQGTAVLRQIHAEMGGIERVERLLEEGAEARAYEREVSELLAGGQMSNTEEDEVEEELAKMQKEEEKEEVGSGKVVEAPSRINLPDAPRTDIEDAEEAEKQRKARAKARAQEQQGAKAAEPMLA